MKQKSPNPLYSPQTAAKPLWPWFSFIFVVLWFVLPGIVSADSTCSTKQGGSQLCDLGDITLKTDIKINGQSTNFVKVGQADGIFKLEVIVTLVSPPTLTLSSSSTKINLTVPPDNIPDSGSFSGFGAEMTPVNTKNVCAAKSDGPFGTGFVYQNCSNPPFDYIQDNSSIKGSVFQAGQIVFDATYTVNSGNLNALGITQLNNATDPNSGVNQFYVYPSAGFKNFGTYWNTYFNGGIGVYAQLYGTQALANSATSKPTACTSTNPNTPTGCVPGYGSSTASGTNVVAGADLTDKLVQLLNEIVAFILGLFQELIYAVFFYLVAPLITAILSIHVYTDSFVAVIYTGWEVVRNLCNIFFIVALIIIALATLFRVDSYKYKDLLVQLIIAALLVNFSLVIAQAVLGIADTVQAQFLGGNFDGVKNLGQQLMLKSNSTLIQGWNAAQNANNSNGSAQNGSLFGGIIQSIFWLALSLGSLVVFAAIAVFLLIRIVAIWLLLLISPVAYAVGVLPATAHYRDEWWKNFLKYAFFTPIMAFFLNMAAIMAANAQSVPIFKQITSDSGIAGLGGIATLVISAGSNILLLVFLIASLKVAEMAGIYGAAGITDIAKKGIFAPFAGASFLGKAGGGLIKKHWDKNTEGLASGKILPKLFGDKGGKWLSRQAFKLAHPIATVGAIREEGKEERELYKGRVGAAATKVARKQFGWRRTTEDPMYLFDEHKGKELYEKEEGKWSPNEQINVGKINRLAEEAKGGDLRASIKLKYAVAEAFRNKNLNEVLEGENGMANRHKELFGGPLNYNSDNIRYFFQQMTKGGYLDEDFTREFLKDLGTDAYSIGDFNGAELVYSDPKTGHAHLIKMAPRGEDGNSLPVGWNNYVIQREAFIHQANTIGTASAITVGTDKAHTKFGAGATPAEINSEIERATEPEIAKALKALEDPFAESHPDDYANSMHAERGRNYMKINLSKKKGGQAMDMFHDSLLNVGVEDGEVTLSDAGTQALGKIDEQSIYSLMRDNMAPKTKEKFKLYTKDIVTNEAKSLGKIKAQLTKVVKDENREKGVFMNQTDIDKQVETRTTLWLAASAGLASGKQAAQVMESYKIKEANTATGTLRETIPQRDARARQEFIQMMKDNVK